MKGKGGKDKGKGGKDGKNGKGGKSGKDSREGKGGGELIQVFSMSSSQVLDPL